MHKTLNGLQVSTHLMWNTHYNIIMSFKILWWGIRMEVLHTMIITLHRMDRSLIIIDHVIIAHSWFDLVIWLPLFLNTVICVRYFGRWSIAYLWNLYDKYDDDGQWKYMHNQCVDMRYYRIFNTFLSYRFMLYQLDVQRL